MAKRSILFLGFGLSVLLWLLNYIALAFYLYWTVWWYDIVMHFLGGLTLGVLVIWFLMPNRSFLIVFSVVMVAIVGWEVFEYVNGKMFYPESYAVDTVIDLAVGALGVVAVRFIAHPVREKSPLGD